MKVISLLSKRSIFGLGKMSFTLFLRQTRGEGYLLITSQLCWYFKKRRIKSGCYVIVCCLFWNLVTIIIAFVPVHVYTLKFGEKITFYHFSKKCLFSVFLHIEVQLSLKNAWLPPVFFLDFNSPWYDLLVSHSHYLGKKYFPLVGTVLKSRFL